MYAFLAVHLKLTQYCYYKSIILQFKKKHSISDDTIAVNQQILTGPGTTSIAQCRSFSCSVISTSLRPHGLQHASLPCPSPSPGVCSNPCPLSRWCHPTTSSSVVRFSSCLQPFPASESFSMSQLFTTGGQSFGASTSASVLPMNIQGWFPLGLTDFTFLQSKGLSRVFSNTLAGSSFSKWRGSELCCLKRKSRKLKSFLLGSDGKHFRIAKNTGSRVRQTWGWWHRQDKPLELQVHSLQHGNSNSTFLRE